MQEANLVKFLIVNPDSIEEGLTFKEKEVGLQGKRCDLLFEDKYGRDLYVEVKLKAYDRAYGQLARYDSLVDNPNARFMIVAFSFVDGLQEALIKNNYEYVQIQKKTVSSFIERLKVISNVDQKKKQEDVRNRDSSELLEQVKRIEKLEERVKYLITEAVHWKEFKGMFRA